MFPMRTGGVDPGPNGLRELVVAVVVFVIGAVLFWVVIGFLA